MSDREPKPSAGKASDARTGARTKAKGADDPKPTRQEREAAALRVNLAKRKAQNRGRKSLVEPSEPGRSDR